MVHASYTLVKNLTKFRFPGIQRMPGVLLLGQLPAFCQSNGEGILELLFKIHKEMETKNTDKCAFWLGHKPVLALANPDLINDFKIHHEKAQKRSIPLLDKFLGNTILNEPEEEWKKERDIIKELVHKQSSLQQLFPEIFQIAKLHVKTAVRSEQPINFKDFFAGYVLDVFTSSFMGVKNSPEKIGDFVRLVNDLTETIFQFRSVFKFMLPSWLRSVVYRGEANNLDNIRNSMKQRLAQLLNDQNNGSLLEKLNATFYRSPTVSIEEQFGRLLFLISAGSATTAATLQFSITMLEAHPQVKAKLLEEFVTIDLDTLSLENLDEHNLPYLELFLNEVWRLFPPTPFYLPREIKYGFKLQANSESIQIEAGDIILASPFLVGRSSKIYQNPEQFNPDRFVDPNVLKPQPFSIGVQQCPGYKLAKLEIKLMLIVLLKNTHFKIENIEPNSTDIELTFRGSMTPKMDLTGSIYNIGESPPNNSLRPN